MTLGQKLRQLREAKGLMQREVGNWIQVDSAMISKVENGDKRINRNHLPILASKFSIQEEELQILWLADKILSVIDKEHLAKDAMNVVIEKI